MKIINAVIIWLIVLFKTYYFEQGLNSVTLETHYVKNRHEKLVGHFMTFPKATGLLPADNFLGIGYASLGNGRMRFMPPSSRKWRHRKSYLKKGYGCMQKEPNWRKYVRQVPKEVAQHMYAVVSEITVKSTECLNLNIYRTQIGKFFIFLMSYYRDGNIR
ncbi:unnamed protein product [Mytilus edulis]|uniref:Carboxylesterase type B domain-containing protein n=1 Tax=Mytilus edulis TaxID=6550 RepID=A0A8S3PPV6_MYTED|nr:unnamed protein product [Mytilus edulis]